ncbi:APC family permease [Gordonia sp. NPDC062954]|uniref:APC family permease n=1 Tax=Gordonia sp. NPDC062954 TaxID=3364003 RepID=UPI0037CB56E9
MPPNQSLRRNAIGVPGLVFLVIAAVGPVGAVLAATPLVFMQNGAGATGTYVLAAALFGVFSVGYVAMSRYMGTAGGFVTYIARGFSPRVGAAAAYAALLVYCAMLCGLYGAFAVFTKQTIDEYFGMDVPWELITLITIALLGTLAYNKVEFSTRILAVLLVVEAAVILILDISIVVRGGDGGGAPMSFIGFTPAAMLTGGIGIAFLFALSSFGGFEATVVFSEEARNPRRTIPLATYASILLIGGFYAFSTWAIANGVGIEEVQQTAQTDPVGFILALSDHYVGPVWSDLMGILVVANFIGILLGFTNILSRYVFAMARVGVLPRGLSRTHTKYQSPHRASLVVSVAAALVTGAFMIASADPFSTMYSLLFALASVGLLSIIAATSLSAIAFFRKNRTPERIWGTTIFPILSAIGFTVAIYLSVAHFDVLTGGQAGLAGLMALPD